MFCEDVRLGWGLRMSAEVARLHKLVVLQYMTIVIPSPHPNAYSSKKPLLLPAMLSTKKYPL